MTTYSTGNPIGSTDPRDLYDNAENLDEAVNSDGDTFQDRMGKSRLTWTGIVKAGSGDPAIAVDAAARAEAAASQVQQDADQIAADAAQQAVDNVVTEVEGQVVRAEGAADRAEAASDAAFVNADVYPDVATGLAVVADGEQFQVVVSDEIVRYRRDSVTVATEVARFPSAAVAGALPQNIRTADFLTRSNFVSGEISGTFAAYNDAETPTPSWEIAGGVLRVTGAFTGSTPRIWKTGNRWMGRGVLKVEMSGKLTSAANNRGLSCYIGDVAGMRVHFGYLRNGVIGVFDNDGSSVSGKGGVATVPAMAWGEDVTATLYAEIYEDGTGFVEATHPDGQKYRHPVQNIVERGAVGPSWQRSDTGEISRFGVVTLDFDDRQFGEINTEIADIQAVVAPAYSLDPLNLVSRGKIATDDSTTAALHVSADANGTTLRSTSAVGFRGVLSGVQATPGEVSAEVTIGAVVARLVGLAVSAGADSQWYIWGGSGGIVRYNQDSSLAAALRPTSPTREWVEGDVLNIAIGIRDDRSGYLNLTKNGVLLDTVDIDAPVPQGEVAVAVSGVSTYVFNSMYIANGIMPRLDNLGQRVSALEASAGLSATRLLDFAVLPDFPADGSRPADTPGFTCTGLARVTRGMYAGCWLVGDDGRIVESESSPYNPHVHLMDMSMRRIIRSYPMPYSGASVQGIAVDTSGGEDTFWVATAGYQRLCHFDMDGMEIVGDRFVWDHVNWGGSPNGLCYVPSLNALWCSPMTGTTSRLIACDPSIPDRVISTMETIQRVDHSQVIESENTFFYTPAGAGIANDDIVIAKDLATGEETTIYTLPRSKSLEGFFIDRSNGRLYGVSDAGYHHTGAAPALNLAFIYSIPSHSVE